MLRSLGVRATLIIAVVVTTGCTTTEDDSGDAAVAADTHVADAAPDSAPPTEQPDEGECPSFGEPETRWTPSESSPIFLTFEIPEGYELDSEQEIPGNFYEMRFNRFFTIQGQRRSISIVTEQGLAPAQQAFIDIILSDDSNLIGPVDIGGQSLMVRRSAREARVEYMLFPEINGERRQATVSIRWASTTGCLPSGEALGDLIVPTMQLIP